MSEWAQGSAGERRGGGGCSDSAMYDHQLVVCGDQEQSHHSCHNFATLCHLYTVNVMKATTATMENWMAMMVARMRDMLRTLAASICRSTRICCARGSSHRIIFMAKLP